MMKAKQFDCVALQHRGAESIYERTKNMTISEELTYWQCRTVELRQIERARKAKKLAPQSSGVD
jgi:hypothetical protein